ncbi:hypothetical protein LQK61_004489 [Vibrio parahaemolyticus]|nr:hypothetical protein [Vibrio parahaemolyticus]EIO4097996.1 hypothetical protein [Vibrio parahaemolyticus]EIY9802918.1 hypothetical protein [Vibrio parahaemolyticus]EJE4731113.1 hypothetical protein [Vibrio parahaemolyticus]TOC01562.1 hypothetical protein CGJ92_25180 [Vibrio parahaemolyticus]
MEKYLYLTEVEWADAWINGGEIPISLASSYLSESREGIYTPDENLIHDSSYPIPAFRQFGIHLENVKNVTMTGNTFNGKKIPDVKNASYYKEDGLILSFCNELDTEIARRLGKKACVKILDMHQLKMALDSEVGSKGVMKNCSYTKGFQRDHFLKSTEDSWQNEFRLFWKSDKSVWVSIPPNIGELVATYD